MLTINNADDLQVKLELILMKFHPDKYIPKYVAKIGDVYQLRYFLRNAYFSEKSFGYLLEIVIEAIEANRRFRTLDCLKVIKKILQNRSLDDPLSVEVKEKLFYVYQKYVFHHNKEIQWAVSTYLKDVTLTEEQIRWLVENEENEMILNRLLRYPIPHPLVIKWAEGLYKKQKHRNRLSEIIALLIDKEIPDFVNTTNRPAILWAIYYAKIDDKLRKRLLIKYYDIKSVDDLVNICLRLNYVDVLENILEKTSIS